MEAYFGEEAAYGSLHPVSQLFGAVCHLNLVYCSWLRSEGNLFSSNKVKSKGMV